MLPSTSVTGLSAYEIDFPCIANRNDMDVSQGGMYNCICSSQDAAVTKAVLGKIPHFPVSEDLAEVCVIVSSPFPVCRILALFMS